MRRFTCVSVVCLVLLSLPAVVHAGVADEVIAVTYAQWAADMANDTAPVGCGHGKRYRKGDGDHGR